MKKIILLVMLTARVLYSVDHGAITGFKLGYNLFENTRTYNEHMRLVSGKTFDGSISLELKMGYRIGNFRFIGTYENILFKDTLDRYVPVQDKYTIDINYTWNNFVFGFQHWCSHPVIAYSGLSDTQDYLENASHRQVYVRYYKEF